MVTMRCTVATLLIMASIMASKVLSSPTPMDPDEPEDTELSDEISEYGEIAFVEMASTLSDDEDVPDDAISDTISRSIPIPPIQIRRLSWMIGEVAPPLHIDHASIPPHQIGVLQP
ncbi:hypothetical protein SeMB42_g07462 [Synchytrium endobioticum]|uniref:Secreted protein n=1 Tax=Synchytrium endobioticum TaxID=286115 RepID=A0A507CJF4_9FUNG|nr:hypothetical protein SeMB42_g07462 [Synchytrium endobioticum]TPX39738.1 hypothetical protein SeLEV6574_g07013 [Synchytrium endobioticum]